MSKQSTATNSRRRTVMVERRDWAVVMARGESRRMGRPKGLCRLPGMDHNFLVSIVRLYQNLDFPVAIVTTPRWRQAYARELTETDEVRWIEAAAGEGTARTVMAALIALADSATHLWLHPVDLPGVDPASLQELRTRSRTSPQAVLVPEYEGQPGHPVVLPSRPFAALEPSVPPGAMRPWLLELTRPGPDQLAPLLAVPLTDAGVIRDYDDPEALA